MHLLVENSINMKYRVHSTCQRRFLTPPSQHLLHKIGLPNKAYSGNRPSGVIDIYPFIWRAKIFTWIPIYPIKVVRKVRA
jgi:hypothetical protein